MASVFLFLGSFGPIGWLVLVALLILGIMIIIMIAKLFLFIIPAALVAFVVWLVTSGNKVLAGIAFIAITVLSFLKR